MVYGGMVEQVSGATRPRQDTSRCHWGEPLVLTENSLSPHAVVLPGARTCCRHQPCLHPLLVLEPPLTPLPALLLDPTAGASPDCLVPSVGVSGGC